MRAAEHCWATHSPSGAIHFTRLRDRTTARDADHYTLQLRSEIPQLPQYTYVRHPPYGRTIAAISCNQKIGVID